MKNRVLFLSRVMPHFRLKVMKEIWQKMPDAMVLAYSGQPIKGEKVRDVLVDDTIPTYLLDFKSLPIPVLGKRYSLGYFKNLGQFLYREKPSAIVLEGESNFINNLILRRYTRKLSIPYIWWSCGRVRNQPETKVRRLFKPLIKSLIQEASALIGYSSYAKDYYQKEFKVNPEKIFVAPNSVPSKREWSMNQQAQCRREIREELGIPQDGLIMLYVGALVPEKRPGLLVDLLEKLKLPNLHLLVVGEGPSKEELEKRKNSQVHLLGRVVEGVEKFFLGSDLFVMPGLGGLALQQAMSCGCPVISGIADGTELDLIQDGQNGYFISDEEGIETWLEKCREILLDDNKRKSFGLKSQEIIAKDFNIHIMIEQISKAIEYAKKDKLSHAS